MCGASLRASDQVVVSATHWLCHVANNGQWCSQWAQKALFCSILKNLPTPNELDTVFRAFLCQQTHSHWDHDSSEQVSWLMDREDLCVMCFCDTHISHNFHSQWNKVSEGWTLTCISEPEAEMRNRRQIRQLPSDKLTSRNRNRPRWIQWNCHTPLLKTYLYFQQEH